MPITSCDATNVKNSPSAYGAYSIILVQFLQLIFQIKMCRDYFPTEECCHVIFHY